MADTTQQQAADSTTAPEAGAAGQGGGQDPNQPPANESRIITLSGFGGIRNVKVEKRPEVQPKEGEVLIRVKACGLNFNDLMLRQGALDNPPKTPFTMGFECAGEVEALGENVDRFMKGDSVIALTDCTAWSELIAVPAQFVYRMPSSMSYQDGAALLVNYVTAYLLLFEVGGLRRGQSVLVHSAGGGVGHAVCQLVRTMDDITLFGTASYGKHESIKNNLNHLYDHVVDYCQEIRKVSPEGVDLVLDSVCGEDTKKGLSILKPLGRYILYGSSCIVTGDTKSFLSVAKSWWQVDKISPNRLFEENKTMCGFNLRQLLFRQNRHEFIRDIVNRLFQMYMEGKIRPKVDSAWAFEDVGDAMQKMHERKNIGKIILDPSLQPKPKAQPASSSPFNFSLSSIQNNITQKISSSSNNSTEKPSTEEPASAPPAEGQPPTVTANEAN